MAGASFSVTFTIDKGGFLDDLKIMQARLTDEGLRKFLADEVNPYLQDRMEQRFSSEGDDAVGSWLPLSFATEATRIAAGYGGAHPINRRTDEMYDFLVGEDGDVTAGGGGAYLIFPGKSVDGLTAEKIVTAQQGKSSPPTPARPVLGLSGTDEEGILNDLVDYIVKDTLTISGVVRL